MLLSDTSVRILDGSFPWWIWAIPNASSVVSHVVYGDSIRNWLPLFKQILFQTAFVPLNELRSYFMCNTVPNIWLLNRVSFPSFEALVPSYVFLIICPWKVQNRKKINLLGKYTFRAKHTDAGGCTSAMVPFTVFGPPHAAYLFNSQNWNRHMFFPLLTHVNSSSPLRFETLQRFHDIFISSSSLLEVVSVNNLYDAHGLFPFDTF